MTTTRKPSQRERTLARLDALLTAFGTWCVLAGAKDTHYATWRRRVIRVGRCREQFTRALRRAIPKEGA
jgi:hypothetical protein